VVLHAGVLFNPAKIKSQGLLLRFNWDDDAGMMGAGVCVYPMYRRLAYLGGTSTEFSFFADFSKKLAPPSGVRAITISS